MDKIKIKIRFINITETKKKERGWKVNAEVFIFAKFLGIK
jgi:hypothetical protein